MVMRDGDNVISFPVDDLTLHGDADYMKVSEFINRVGSDKVSKVLKWNNGAQVYEQYPAFDSLDVDKGYLVVLHTNSNDTILDVMGSVWTPVTLILKEQLNLINLPLDDYTNVSQLVTALGGKDNVKFISRYNKDLKKYEQYLPSVDKGDFVELDPGYGYYVFLTKDLTDKSLPFSGGSWI
jgi:hypothetical protein